MRGKLCRSAWRRLRRRIIPAHAGQTTPGVRVSPPSTDHPRACGANQAMRVVVISDNGSSPRMRGKRVGLTREVAHGRIIPAHAGQTPIHVIPFMIIPDHPRACGANRYVSKPLQFGHGSSPRMRGKPCPRCCQLISARIIPAHAGQTRNVTSEPRR